MKILAKMSNSKSNDDVAIDNIASTYPTNGVKVANSKCNDDIANDNKNASNSTIGESKSTDDIAI